MTTEQTFIINEIWILAWNASVQRANLYKDDLKSEDRKTSKFRASIITYIEKEILQSYKNGCSEDQHYQNIGLLIEEANKLGESILGQDGYKYGVAQKLLNLALKYMWCLGHIKEPPHCPVDRIVINKTSFKGKLNWTQIKSKAPYKNVIEEIKQRPDVKNSSLAQWELLNYARR